MRKNKMARDAVYTYAVKFADDGVSEEKIAERYREAYKE